MITIPLSELHASVQDVLRDRLWGIGPGQNPRPEDTALRAVQGRRWKVIGLRVLAAAPLGGLTGMSLASAFGGAPPAVNGIAFMCAVFGAAGTFLGSMLSAKLSKNEPVTAEDLRGITEGLELGDPETIYLDTVCSLLEAGDNVSGQTRHDILHTLNDLLEQAKVVYSRLDRLQKAAGSESVGDLEEERAKLDKRLEVAQDPQARQDLTQGLQICDDRLTNARALAPLVERMAAQRVVIEQTLLSVRSTVTRLQVAPAAVAAPDVEEVKRVVSEVTLQTQAVEDAVQEVLTVSS